MTNLDVRNWIKSSNDTRKWCPIVICMSEVIPLGGITFGALVEVSYVLADSNTYIKCSN